MNLGLPFWKMTEYEKRREQEIPEPQFNKEINPIST
jgi:hypothetical protein